MFSLVEIKEYSLIVSVNDDIDDVRILRVSDDIKEDEALSCSNGIALTDVSIDEDWYDNWEVEAGVYKLVLEALYDDEKEFHRFEVLQVETLFVL